MSDPLGTPDPAFQPTLYAMAAVVYAERDGQILLLERAGGALAGQWFLPGGAVDPGEPHRSSCPRRLGMITRFGDRLGIIGPPRRQRRVTAHLSFVQLPELVELAGVC